MHPGLQRKSVANIFCFSLFAKCCNFLVLRKEGEVIQRRATVLVFAALLVGRTAWGSPCTHEILPGQTLAELAKLYRSSPSALAKTNHISETSTLQIGQRIRIPGGSCDGKVRTLYSVKRGDSLSALAKRNGMTVVLLKRLNPKATEELRLGQKLWILARRSAASHGPGGLHLYHLDGGPGYRVLMADRSWCDFTALTRLLDVFSKHYLAYPKAAPLRVGDISTRDGGRISPHVSHGGGRDVDIRLPLLKDTESYVSARPSTLDVPRTWNFIRLLVKTGDVQYIFIGYNLQRVLYAHAEEQGVSEDELRQVFQFPRGRRAMTGIVRHEPGHTTHMHIRFFKRDASELPTS
jgi:LysM repeat protein